MALSVHIHPLVIMSIADHHVRGTVSGGERRVVGILLGTQEGRTVEVLETFELGVKSGVSDPEIVIESAAFDEDLKLFREAYPDYECLGWYSIGAGPARGDLKFHEQLKAYNERPLYVLLDASAAESESAAGAAKAKKLKRDLPLSVYEQAVQVAKDGTTTAFVPSPCTVSALEAERVTMVHCAKVINATQASGSASTIVPQLTTVASAVAALQQRVALLRRYVVDVRENRVPADHDILRQMKSLCARLPTMKGDAQFRESYVKEYGDSLLVTYLAAITQSNALCNDLVTHHNFLQNQSDLRRGFESAQFPPMRGTQ